MTISPLVVSMESNRTQADLQFIKNRFCFIQRVKTGEPLIFIEKTSAELNHALYIACLYNQFGSAQSIINHCRSKSIAIHSIYTHIGLLVAQLNQNKELIHLLNENEISKPIDINKAIYFSVKIHDHVLFEKLTSSKFDCENSDITQALKLAIMSKNFFMMEQLQKLGVKLENVTPVKHPRIAQIQQYASRLQKLAIKKS